MLITFTDVVSKNPVSINPKYIVAIFEAPAGTPAPENSDIDMSGKTVIGLTTGSMVVEQKYLEVVGLVQGELNS